MMVLIMGDGLSNDDSSDCTALDGEVAVTSQYARQDGCAFSVPVEEHTCNGVRHASNSK